MCEKVAYILPFIEFRRLENGGFRTAEDGVIRFAFEPAMRVPGRVLAVVWVPLFWTWDDGVCRQLLPEVQVLICTGGDAVANAAAVIEHCGFALFVDEAVAAEDAGFGAVWSGKQRRRMMTPV